jgi:hypothetical protein
MKIDIVPTGAAAIGGGCVVAFGEPVLAFVATNVHLACIATSAAILTGAAWAGLAHRRRPDPLPDVVITSPPLTIQEWFEANGVHPDEGPEVTKALIQAGLKRQLEATTLREARIEALFLCLLGIATSKPGGPALLEELAKAAAGTDPDGGTAHLLKRHGLRTDPAVIEIRDRIAAGHGTAATMILAALDKARLKCACPSSAMTWVKRVDRGLWYAVSNLGRHAHHVEGIAAIAHYTAEVSGGARSSSPLVDAATRALFEHFLDLPLVLDAPVPEAA